MVRCGGLPRGLATQDGQLTQVTTQEPQLLGVKRLLAPAVASTKLVNPGSVRLRLRGIHRPQQKSYSAYSPRPVDLLPASSFSFPEASTSPGGQSYYNVTNRPAGRPNVSNANFMFPLAIPNAITSLFGWRIHHRPECLMGHRLILLYEYPFPFQTQLHQRFRRRHRDR